jgi:1,2-dihydroxy-3-keto-5-methylthiopentene dioxygenase
MGARPNFRAVRFYRTDDGFVADFTGDPIPERFPRLEDLSLRSAVASTA